MANPLINTGNNILLISGLLSEVNFPTATRFTPQYQGLEDLYKKYGDQVIQSTHCGTNSPIKYYAIP